MLEGLRPYPDYRTSGVDWLGNIPAHWQVQRIKALFRERDEHNGRPDGNLLSLTRSRGVLPQSEASKRIARVEDLSNYKTCHAGDLVMNRMQAWSGMFGLSTLDGVISPDYALFRPIAEMDVRFAERLFKTPILVAQFAARSRGIGSGFNRLYSEDFGAIHVPLPPADEQVTIVHFLQKADRLFRRYVSSKRMLVALLNEQKQGMTEQILSTVSAMVDANGGAYRTRLKYVASVQTGITLGKSYAGRDTQSYPYLRVANVQNGYLNLDHIKFIDVPRVEAVGCELVPGDVLMTEGGDIDKLGRGCVWNGEIEGCLHQNHIFAVRPHQDRLLPDYLALVLGSRATQEYFLRNAKQTTNLASTNSTTLGNLPIVLPKVELQRGLIERMATGSELILRAIRALQVQIERCLELRECVIVDAVMGSIDVRGVSANSTDEPDEFGFGDELEPDEADADTAQPEEAVA